MSLKIPRPVDPIAASTRHGNYRSATPAIEGFLRTRHALSALPDHGRAHLWPVAGWQDPRHRIRAASIAREYPKITTYHAQCEHKPRHAEGPFFATLLEAVGDTVRTRAQRRPNECDSRCAFARPPPGPEVAP